MYLYTSHSEKRVKGKYLRSLSAKWRFSFVIVGLFHEDKKIIADIPGSWHNISFSISTRKQWLVFTRPCPTIAQGIVSKEMHFFAVIRLRIVLYSLLCWTSFSLLISEYTKLEPVKIFRCCIFYPNNIFYLGDIFWHDVAFSNSMLHFPPL